MARELDHAMLRRLEKRILVDLPNESAREAMFKHYLRPVISHSPFKIVTEVDYDVAAKVILKLHALPCAGSRDLGKRFKIYYNVVPGASF